jgi:hypothetical protein
MSLKEIPLETLRATAADIFTDELREDVLEWTQFRDYQLHALCVNLRAKIFAEELQSTSQTVEFHYFATWKDHFKASHFPKRLLRRFPIRMKTRKKKVTFQRLAAYPQLPLAMRTGRVVVKEFIRADATQEV